MIREHTEHYVAPLTRARRSALENAARVCPRRCWGEGFADTRQGSRVYSVAQGLCFLAGLPSSLKNPPLTAERDSLHDVSSSHSVRLCSVDFRALLGGP